MRVLFAAAEIYPYAKTGGLGDIAAALPKALANYCSITSVMPLYSFVAIEGQLKHTFFLSLGSERYEIKIYSQEGTYFVYEPTLCDVKRPYGYANDWLRFAIFCKAVAKLAQILQVDLLHLNDWHTALGAYYYEGKKILTIHNLAYQGIFPASIMEKIDLDPALFDMEHFEFWGKVNYLKGGIALSEAVTTVSPTYAEEIQTAEFGCGLDGFLRRYASKLRGILNGIDYSVWNPATDGALFVNFDRSSYERRIENKERLLHTQKPLFVFIGRLVEQKGIHLLLALLERFAAMPLELFIVGEGDAKYAKALQQAHFTNIHTFIGYDERLSRRLYAACDFLLMPSLFEPCGLNQMIAARYGGVPIVNPVGGLRDTVHQNRECAWGLCMSEPTADDLLATIEQALLLPRDLMGHFNMGCDFSIERSARDYFALYQEIVWI